MIEEVSRNEMLSTIHYMTEHFPYRLAGSPCEAAASRYVTERLKQYGLEVENKEFYTYNSDPMYSKVTVLEPEMEIDSLPCAHIRATKPEGEIFELIYVGNGDYAAYKDIDVTGKMVLVEVSYAPPVPEKARIAYEMGAAGIMCMNWGNDEEVICRRGLKGVWGNPTEANFHCIPEIVGVGVTRGAGLKLKQLCLEGRKVEVKVTAIADRTWSIVHQPTAILHGNGSSDEFLLVCSHLDAWKPGVTCNATGNATTLEICRILSKHRQELDRDVYFVFWDGHEVAEAAGSTWFVDNNWDNLNKHCVCYMHIDSTGVKETELYEIKASEELLGFAKKNINEVLPELELRAMALKKIGDQSFMGIGVSSITQRKSFTKEYMEHAHGATLGWWNHTIEDGEDKCDPVALEEDTRATLKVLYDLATAKLLPYITFDNNTLTNKFYILNKAILRTVVDKGNVVAFFITSTSSQIDIPVDSFENDTREIGNTTYDSIDFANPQIESNASANGRYNYYGEIQETGRYGMWNYYLFGTLPYGFDDDSAINLLMLTAFDDSPDQNQVEILRKTAKPNTFAIIASDYYDHISLLPISDEWENIYHLLIRAQSD